MAEFLKIYNENLNERNTGLLYKDNSDTLAHWCNWQPKELSIQINHTYQYR